MYASKSKFGNMELVDLTFSEGAVIYAGNAASITIEDSYFGNNKANDIFAMSTKVIVRDTEFKGLNNNKQLRSL